MNHEQDEPEILEAQWEREQVESLFADLKRGTETGQVDIKHIQVRTAADQGVVQDRSVTLAEADQLFRVGQARAIQLRYHYDREAWCDTLMVGGQTTRVIRTRQ